LTETLNPRQHLDLIQEMETSIYLIQEGVLALNRLDGANDFSHLPLELLAQGFERFIKLGLVLGLLEEEGALPGRKRLKEMGGGRGHNVVALLDELLALGERTRYTCSSVAAQTDHAFMRRDPLLRAMFDVMSEFGEGGRYHALDGLLEPAREGNGDGPSDRFAAIESLVLEKHPEWQDGLGTSEFDTGYWPIAHSDMTYALQRTARAISRYFTIGPCQAQGKALTGTVSPFLFLHDRELHRPT